MFMGNHGAGMQFQSTLPAGGATIGVRMARWVAKFQSTLPAGGATEQVSHHLQIWLISIHAPRRGSDLREYYWNSREDDFNPRSPQGERLWR